LSARTWPAGRPDDEEAKVAVPDPTPTVDLSAMAPERVHERARELEDGLRAARRERDEAAVEVATRKGRLIEAAGRGFEAAKTAQRQIAEAEEQLRTAELVTEAVGLAHRPFAEESHRLRRIEIAERFGAALAEKGAERNRIDEDLVKALDAIGIVAALREAATAEAAAIRKAADQAGCNHLQHLDPGYVSPAVRAAIERLPLPIRRAIGS